jgi:hypothetical protein
MGKEGDGLLWVETVKFRGERMADLFHELQNEGRKFGDNFFVLPNLSPYQHVDGIMKRVGISHVLSAWARECSLIMFEEMQQPGSFDKGIVSSLAFQYKYAFAETTNAGCLLYNTQDESGVELSIAESCAGGGGCFIHGGYSCPDLTRRYRKFLSRSKDLFDGMRTYSSLGLVFLYDQLSWGSTSHLENAFRVSEELMAQHFLFDLVVERNLHRRALTKYRALIAPDLGNLSPHQYEVFLDYLRGGGILIVIGDFRRYGRRRSGIPASEFEEISHGIRTIRIGDGRLVHIDRLERVLTPPAFELFMISEEDSLDINQIMRLIDESGDMGKRRRTLVPSLRDWTGIVPISYCEETLRFNSFLKRDGTSLTLHAINYDIPIRAGGTSGPPNPSGKTRISLPVPDGIRVVNAELFEPPRRKSERIEHRSSGGVVSFDLPSVDIYSIIKLTVRK